MREPSRFARSRGGGHQQAGASFSGARARPSERGFEPRPQAARDLSHRSSRGEQQRSQPQPARDKLPGPPLAVDRSARGGPIG
jgi:hypothetical protein